MNNNIKIIQTNSSSSDELIYDVMKVEEAVFDEEYRGEYESIIKRFHIVRDMLFLAYDNEKLVGYFCFLPINNKVYNDLVLKGIYHDDDLEPDELVNIDEAEHLLLLSIAIIPEYQNIGIAGKFMKSFEEMVNKHKNIKSVVACTITSGGEKFVKFNGYSMLFDNYKDKGYKIYEKRYL